MPISLTNFDLPLHNSFSGLFYFFFFFPTFKLLAECVVELEKEGGRKEMGSASGVGDKQVNRG